MQQFKFMKTNILLLLLSVSILFSCKNNDSKKNETTSKKITIKSNLAQITPIIHATAVISFNDEIIYLDPTGGAKAFENFEKPNYVLITDIHGDHMNKKTLSELDLSTTTIIAPQAVANQLENIQSKEIIVMNNNEKKSFNNFSIEAIPMYNLREEALKFHTKGRGNGYILTINNERIYFSGDTEDIQEMRNLKNIDRAYICMNLPYTMTVESAADAVLDFKPKKVFPYHYRGGGGLSDISKFKKLVNEKDKFVEVVQQNWYPNRKY